MSYEMFVAFWVGRGRKKLAVYHWEDSSDEDRPHSRPVATATVHTLNGQRQAAVLFEGRGLLHPTEVARAIGKLIA